MVLGSTCIVHLYTFPFVMFCIVVDPALSFWGAEGAPILFSDLGLRMASCSYIYIYIYFCHFANGGAHVVLYKALNPL